MHLMTFDDIREDLPGLPFLDFGNIDCGTNNGQQGLRNQCSGVDGAQVIIQHSNRYQKVLGFGGAFTEASAHNFFQLPKDIQDKVLELYFGPNGIGLTMGRIHINSCDFSLSSYDFDSVPGDVDLAFFDDEVTHDSLEIIPFIQAAIERAGRQIDLVASPWSPPGWMKVPRTQTGSNNKSPLHSYKEMLGSAEPRGLSSDPRIQLAWARYISRFISAYRSKGIDIWALTPQNEPEFAAPWEACLYNSSAELQFIEDYLGPVLRSDHPELKLLAFDHNKDHLRQWAEFMLANDKMKYIDGFAFHCKCSIYVIFSMK
jgi:glucosylceramidase